MEIKGTMMVDYIRMIRANKDKDWDKWLSEKDWEIINQKILVSSWYPYETFRNIGFATFKVLANSDFETAKNFGRLAMKNLMKVYHNIVVPGEPVSSVRKYSAINKVVVRGGYSSEITEHGDNWFKYKWNFGDENEEEERRTAFLYQMLGMIEELIEKVGGKNVKIEHEREGDFFILHATWE